MGIYSVIVHIHSGLRWLALIFILITVVNSVYKLLRKPVTNDKECFFNRVSMIVMHVQLVFGLILYFISPKVVFDAASMKDSFFRFFLVEHIALMIIAVILITIGYVKSGRATDDMKKRKVLVVYYSIAFLLILAAVPWPFRGFGSGWF